MPDDRDFIPSTLLSAVAALPPVEHDGDSPLPRLAQTWYLMGGCWSLVLAIHEQSGLPIEVYYLQGRPHHAYAVDGAWALDARGWNELRLVRIGAERTEQVGDADALVTLLLPVVPDVRVLLENPDVRAKATRAAKVVLTTRPP